MSHLQTTDALRPRRLKLVKDRRLTGVNGLAAGLDRAQRIITGMIRLIAFERQALEIIIYLTRFAIDRDYMTH
jgi:hypothetical protein